MPAVIVALESVPVEQVAAPAQVAKLETKQALLNFHFAKLVPRKYAKVLNFSAKLEQAAVNLRRHIDSHCL